MIAGDGQCEHMKIARGACPDCVKDYIEEFDNMAIQLADAEQRIFELEMKLSAELSRND